jgi:hypothetical protein
MLFILIIACKIARSNNLITIKGRAIGRKEIKRKMERHESETCLLSTYLLVETTILHQLLPCTYCHL